MIVMKRIMSFFEFMLELLTLNNFLAFIVYFDIFFIYSIDFISFNLSFFILNNCIMHFVVTINIIFYFIIVDYYCIYLRHI